jgi:hypothetical protein
MGDDWLVECVNGRIRQAARHTECLAHTVAALVDSGC